MKTLPFISLALLLASCTAQETGLVTFTAGLGNLTEPQGNVREVASQARGIAEIDTFYINLGHKIEFDGRDTLSPSSFVLSMSPPTIHRFVDGEEDHIQFGEILSVDMTEAEIEDFLHVDYVQDYPYEISTEAPVDIYDTIYMTFSTDHSRLGMVIEDSLPYYIWEHPHVIIEVPGYTDSDWPNIESTSKSGAFDRKFLGGNQFEIVLGELLPDFNDLNPGNILFYSGNDLPSLIIPGINAPSPVDLSSYAHVWPTEVTFPVIFLPMPVIQVEDYTEISFNIDTENIISVYDMGTPDDKTDDRAMLINGYWNRFQISTQ